MALSANSRRGGHLEYGYESGLDMLPKPLLDVWFNSKGAGFHLGNRRAFAELHVLACEALIGDSTKGSRRVRSLLLTAPRYAEGKPHGNDQADAS